MNEKALRQLAGAIAVKKAQFRRQLQQRMQSDVRYQAQERMTREEKARVAMDRMAQNFKEYNDKLGKDVTETEIRKETQRIAESVERKRDQ